MQKQALHVIAVCLCAVWMVALRGRAEGGEGVKAGATVPIFRAGAARVDITPEQLPVAVNGWTRERTASRVRDPLHVRTLVLDDGRERLVLSVVASCFIARELLDEAKAKASAATGIPTARMMVSADHIHSAPDAEQAAYRSFLTEKIAGSIVAANDALQPARIGWALVPAYEGNIARRHVMRPDKAGRNSYGETMRAHDTTAMGPDTISPTGPVDPMLALVSVQDLQGRPQAVLATFGFHFIAPHHQHLSGDAAGQFGAALARELSVDQDAVPFIGILAQGACGDTSPRDGRGRPDVFAERLARLAASALLGLTHHDWAPLGMADRLVTFDRRQPSPAQLAWAREIVPEPDTRAPFPGGAVASGETVAFGPAYDARQMIYLHENPTQDVRMQTIRVGALGMVALPYEIFGLTALKLRAQSPLPLTTAISLANGATGYVAPAEQYAFGGYTTLFSTYSGLAEDAEARTVDLALEMLEEVTGNPRTMRRPADDAWVAAILAAQPAGFWPLDDMAGPTARDRSGNGHVGHYEPGVAFYLPGRTSADIDYPERASRRAALFAGGRMLADVPVEADYSIALWVWNGLAETIREVTGHIYGVGDRDAPDTAGDHLFLKPVADDNADALLAFANGQGSTLTGNTALSPRTWYHVAVVRQGNSVSVYLNGRLECAGEAAFRMPTAPRLYLGGRHDRVAPLEGRLHDAAWYTRALAAGDVARHFHARRPAATARGKVIAEIDPAAGFNSFSLHLDDLDTTDPGGARYDRTVDYVVSRSLHHGEQSGNKLTIENPDAPTTVEIVLGVMFEYLGERVADTATARIEVVENEAYPAEAEAVWIGASVLPGGGLGEWWRGANWEDRRVPPFDAATTRVQFTRAGTGVSRLARDRSIGGLAFAHDRDMHRIDLSGYTLTLAGDLVMGVASDGGRVTIENGHLRLGAAGKPVSILMRSGHLRLAAALDTTHLDRVLIPDSTETSRGVLALAGSGIFRANRLHLASESAADKANANAELHMPADSRIEAIVIHDSLRIAASESGNWQTALNSGSRGDGGNWTMPPGLDYQVGVPGRPAEILAVGHGGGWSKRGRLVAGEGGVFHAHVKDLLVGTMDRSGVGWWGSMQPEVAWTPPYGVGNDFLGTLDLSAMARCDIRADHIRIGHPALPSWGTLLVGVMRLPAGRVWAGDVTIGHSYPIDSESNSDAFRPGCGGVLALNGTTLFVDRQLTINETGTLTVRIHNVASGITLAADAGLHIAGKLRLMFEGAPEGLSTIRGLRWHGDRRAELERLMADGRLLIDVDAGGDRTPSVTVLVEEEDVDGRTELLTYIGLEG